MTRRPTASDPSHRERVTEGLRSIQRASQGVMKLDIAFRDDAGELALAVLLGDPDALLLAHRLKAAMEALAGHAPQCLLCDATPGPDEIAAIAILAPHGAPPEAARGIMVNAICADCIARLATKPAVVAAARDRYVAGISGFRAIDIHDQSGRA